MNSFNFKLLILTFVLGMASAAAAANEKCNFPIQNTTYTSGKGGLTTDYISGAVVMSPKRISVEGTPVGTCDLLGSLKGASVLDCRNVAKAKGYDCFQVTSFTTQVEYYSDVVSRESTLLCYACIR
jgi:hypothetical protein